jgi:hypothetical protein
MNHQACASNSTLPVAAARSARIYSNVVSPPIVNAALGFAVALSSAPLGQGLAWGAVYSSLLCLMPMAVVVYLLKTGRVSDLHMSNTGERHIPYLITFVGAVLAFAVVTLFGGPALLRGLLACNILGLAALGIINVYWLISNHAASIMLATVFAGYAFGLTAVLALLPLVGLTLLARLVLKRHTVPQLIAGLLVGAAPVLLFAGLGVLQ